VVAAATAAVDSRPRFVHDGGNRRAMMNLKRFWSDLSVWNKFGVCFVLAVVALLLALLAI